MLEQCLIDCCAPTLAGMKSASLFTWNYGLMKAPKDQIRRWNRSFCRFGLHVCILREDPFRHSMLLYIFRSSQIQAQLNRPCVRDFLKGYGYPDGEGNLYRCIARLKERIADCNGFPHEIGIFLGYPLCDVKGFIDNEGKNYKAVGPWKVYENEAQTCQVFRKYKKCTAVYNRLWMSGQRSVLQMTVAG